MFVKKRKRNSLYTIDRLIYIWGGGGLCPGVHIFGRISFQTDRCACIRGTYIRGAYNQGLISGGAYNRGLMSGRLISGGL